MTSRLFDTVLVANRGEIAVRVIRTLREWASARSPSTATPTPDARHVARGRRRRRASARRRRAQSYLDIDAVVAAAARTGAQAIHPGYGFLSENADFAARLRRRPGIVFIGPPVAAIEAMGDKIARQGDGVGGRRAGRARASRGPG